MTDQNAKAKPQKLGERVLMPPAGCGLGCLTTALLGFVALQLGFCFIWPNAVPFGGIICFSIVLVVVFALSVMRRRVSWRALLLAVIAISFFWTVFSLWRAPRSILSFFLPQRPPGVVVHKAHFFQAGPDAMVWIHFSAPSEVMGSIIKDKGLAASEDDGCAPPGGYMGPKPNWWNPTNQLTHPVLYVHRHQSAVPWVQAMWVNDMTNEAYGYMY